MLMFFSESLWSWLRSFISPPWSHGPFSPWMRTYQPMCRHPWPLHQSRHPSAQQSPWDWSHWSNSISWTESCGCPVWPTHLEEGTQFSCQSCQTWARQESRMSILLVAMITFTTRPGHTLISVQLVKQLQQALSQRPWWRCTPVWSAGVFIIPGGCTVTHLVEHIIKNLL